LTVPAEDRSIVEADGASPRILLLSDRYLPEVGGSITWFHNVYTRHAPGTVWILTNSHRNSREFDSRFPQVRMARTSLRRYRFLKPESLLMYVKLFLGSAWLILRRRIRIIHAGKNLPEGFVARRLWKLLGVPYVVYAHGEEITVLMENPKLAPRIPPIYTDAAAVVANSSFTQGLLEGMGVDPARIARISPGVDPLEFRPGERDPDLRRRHGLDGRTVLLTVGRLQRRKGHDMVIRALPRILAAHPDVVYLVAGDGEEMESLERLAGDEGVAGSVRFLGRVPQEDLPALYNLSDVFVMANRTMPGGDVEGFGIVFLEAGACGKPVIAGASGGTADAVIDGVTGILVDGTSTEEIARAVIRLAADPALRSRMGEAGRRRVEREYNWDAIAERTERLSAAVVERSLAKSRASTTDTRRT
jgi:phosphatidylinositol alpha-1,6-mannosyltransferase